MTHLFLDLEDTVITPVLSGWRYTELIPSNISLVKSFMKANTVLSLNIFSFALWDQKQIEEFGRFTQPELEEALGRKFHLIPDVDGMITRSCAAMSRINLDRLSFSDIVDFFGKERAFELFILHRFEEGKFTLFDDSVRDKVITTPTHTIEFIRV